MSKLNNRLVAKERTKLTMFFSGIAAEVPKQTFAELYILACDLLGRNIAESSLKGLFKDMGLTYKAHQQARNGERNLQRDTLRAVCALLVKQNPSLEANSLIRKFVP